MFSTFNYIEYATGNFKNRGRFTTVERFKEEQFPNLSTGLTTYRSYFRFEKDFYLYGMSAEGQASISGFSGKHITDFVWLDIDSHEPEEDVRFKEIFVELDRTLEVLSKYLDPKNVVVEFSGWGGFHLSIPAGYVGFEPSNDLAVKLTKFVKNLFVAPTNHTIKKGVDFGVYRVDTLLKLRNSKSEKCDLYKTKIDFNDLDVLRENPQEIKFYCDKPKPLASKYLEPEPYWFPEPIPEFQEIWNRKEEEKKVYQGYTFTGFKPQGMPQCVSNIVSKIIKNEFPENSGRNNAFTILAAFYRNYVPTEDALISLLRSFNSSLKFPLPDDDIVSTVKQNFKAGGYGTGCMNPDSSLGTLGFCNHTGSLFECPEYLKKQKEAPSERIWMWADEAFDAMMKDISKGVTDISFSFEEFAKINKFLKYNDIVLVQGASTTGKSMFSMREMRHLVDIARNRGEFVCLGIPEQNIEDYSKLISMQMLGATLSDLYKPDIDVSLAMGWFEKNKDSCVIQKAVNMTAADWEKSIVDAEQNKGRKCMVAFLDGLGFLRPAAKIQAENHYAQLAMDIVSLAGRKNMIVWINHHLTKSNTKNAKLDVKYQRGGVESGHGSGYLGKSASYVFSVYLDEQDGMNVSLEKCKQHWNKPVALPSVRVFTDGSFGIYTAREVEKLNIYSSFSDADQELIRDQLYSAEDYNIMVDGI